MKPQKWPVYRQLTGTDRRGLGAAAKSDRPRVARTSTADAVVKSVSPYCAVGCAQNVRADPARGRHRVRRRPPALTRFGVFEADLVTARDPEVHHRPAAPPP